MNALAQVGFGLSALFLIASASMWLKVGTEKTASGDLRLGIVRPAASTLAIALGLLGFSILAALLI